MGAAVHRHSLDRLNAINDSLKKKNNSSCICMCCTCHITVVYFHSGDANASND